VFTARYGLMPYIKHITLRLLKVNACLLFRLPAQTAIRNADKFGVTHETEYIEGLLVVERTAGRPN
jgi:hypothetical protein